MTNSIAQATYNITDQSLENMALDLKNLPDELSGFSPFRESVLDNKLMASHGFPGNTEDKYNAAGRMTGYLREFASPSAIPKREDGQNIVAATVIHLFENEDSAASWMTNVFVKQFKENIGREVGEDQKLVAVEELEIEDFYDRAVGIRAVQDGVDGILSLSLIHI